MVDGWNCVSRAGGAGAGPGRERERERCRCLLSVGHRVASANMCLRGVCFCLLRDSKPEVASAPVQGVLGRAGACWGVLHNGSQPRTRR
jgi:hypothetical protein